MKMTKEEAEKKSCPFASQQNCIADRCMAWEWVEFNEKTHAEIVLREYDKTEVAIPMVAHKPTKGICRLIYDGKSRV